MKNLVFLLCCIINSFILYSQDRNEYSKLTNLTETQKEIIAERAKKVNCETAANFEKLYSEWIEKSNSDMKTKVSSYSNAACKLPEFSALVEMGEPIIPLIIQKMADSKNFRACHIYESITGKRSNDKWLQRRAQNYVLNWLETQ